MSEKHTCCGKVWSGFRHDDCGRGAKYEHEGKWYCKTHHPPTVQAKSDARNVKWEAEWKARSEREQAARDAEVEQKRRADCHDQLVAALRSALHCAQSENHQFRRWHLQAAEALERAQPKEVSHE